MIGVFDSGLGGLSVLSAVRSTLPGADLVYLADTAHLPYGAKSDDFIRARVLTIGRHLALMGCSTVVVACNTATAAAVGALRSEHPGMSVVGVEPGIKPAAASTRSGCIAVLATESTAQSAGLARLIRDHAGTATVHVVACPGWATHIERLDLNDPILAAEVAAKVLPLLDAGIDRLVLGCTHYSFLVPLLEPLIARRAELVDVADAVARQVVRLWSGSKQREGRLALMATARPERLDAALPALGLSWLSAQSAGPAQLMEI